VKPTTATIDNDTASWSLSWQPEGYCNSFTQEAIQANAPATSGVYGLFNFHCQVFIGESANIREALMRHERETDFQSAHLRPTGFTFEPCAQEACKNLAARLITQFRPVMQSQAALDESPSPFIGVGMDETAGYHQLLNNHADQDFPPRDEQRPQIPRRSDFKGTLVTTLAATALAASVFVFYFGLPARMQPLITVADKLLMFGNASKHPAPSGAAELAFKPRNPSANYADVTPANQNTQVAPAESKFNDSRTHQDGTVSPTAKSSSIADKRSIKKSSAPAAESAQSSAPSTLNKKWTVQISAAPAKDIADTLVQRLKANGYDGYSVQAEVQGQTYYRVRVGHFDAREQAEAMRQTLSQQEGYRDAYLTED